MNVARLAIIAVAVWLAIYLLRRALHYLTPSKTASTPTESAKNMVRCAQCGLHLPESEAIAHHGHYFCCQEHRRQHSDSA
jgi:uncharacterized protein